jgi:hypothetical protein
MTNDDPYAYSADDLADPRKLRDQLAVNFGDSANWRGQKAAEYPDDTRNAASEVALEVAAQEVAKLPADDPRLRLLASFWETWGSADLTAYLDSYAAEEQGIISRHGFGPGATQTTGELLAALVNAALRADRDARSGSDD